MKRPRVTILGSFMVDLVATAERFPVPGETVKGYSFKIGPGGKAANQGVAAHRAGAEARVITKVGKDHFGRIALDSFKNEKIDISLVFEDDRYETGVALIMVDGNSGQNKIIATPGACNYITDENLELAGECIENSDIFLTQLENNMDAIEKGINIAYRKGVRIILNPAPAHPISDVILQKLDYITPNETEASILTGIDIQTQDDVRNASEVLLNKGVKNVVITLGVNGIYARTKDKELFIPVIPVKVVETIGAGDAFNGAFAAALAEGMDFFEAAMFGNIAGGLSVTKVGAATAMPYRNEIDEYLS